MTRRLFLKQTGISIATLPFLSIATANTLYGATPTFSDYKAMVVLHFHGGNDALNTFVPTDTTKHNDYANLRKKIAIANTNLLEDDNYEKDENGYYKAKADDKNPYVAKAPENPSDIEPQDDLEAIYRKGNYSVGSLGINAMMPELAALYEKGVFSIVSNVGTLVEPTTKEKIQNENVSLPLFLFAHDHQRRAIQTARADVKITNGWLGRVADSFAPINDNIGLNISLHGLNTMLVGEKTSPLVFGNQPDMYSVMTLTSIIEKFAGTKDTSIFESLYKRINLGSKTFSDKFDGVWENSVDFSQFDAKNSYGQELFSVPNPQEIGIEEPVHKFDESLFNDLKTVAKLIKLGKSTFNYNRQVFYISLGGFDFHSSQPKDHLQKLRSISLAVSDFYKALEEMGLHQEVVLASTSDFGRSLLSNGDGTDHGWGGHSFIMCGDSKFNGGQILGEDIVSYALDSENFYPQRKAKGRLIPTTSIEQMFAPILDWFGVEEQTMEYAFANLKNFRTQSDNYKSAFLPNVFTS